VISRHHERVMVTGAGSFIGGHLIRRLAAGGHEVIALCRSAPPPSGVSAVRADLAEGVPAAVPSCDTVIHVAAVSQAPGRTLDEFIRDNYVATRNLAAWAASGGARRVIYLSAMSVYGRVIDPVVGSDTPIRDPDAYGISKHLGELTLRERAETVPALALRIPGVVGPGAHRNWLARTKAALLAGEPVSIFNPDAPFNNAVHVADLCDFLVGLSGRDWRGFDVVPLGAADTLTIEEVVRLLAERTGSASSLCRQASAATSFIIDNGPAMERHGYRPAPLPDILRRFADDGPRVETRPGSGAAGRLDR